MSETQAKRIAELEAELAKRDKMLATKYWEGIRAENVKLEDRAEKAEAEVERLTAELRLHAVSFDGREWYCHFEGVNPSGLSLSAGKPRESDGGRESGDDRATGRDSESSVPASITPAANPAAPHDAPCSRQTPCPVHRKERDDG